MKRCRKSIEEDRREAPDQRGGGEQGPPDHALADEEGDAQGHGPLLADGHETQGPEPVLPGQQERERRRERERTVQPRTQPQGAASHIT
jgi:hypothetical protein